MPDKENKTSSELTQTVSEPVLFAKYVQTFRRLSLLFGIVVGLASIIYYVKFSTLAINDFKVYYFAAEASLQGKIFTGPMTGPNGEFLDFLYPPISVIYFYLYTPLPTWFHGYIAHNILNGIVAIVTAHLTISYVNNARSSHLSQIDKRLIYGVMLLSPFPVMTFAQGQMNLILLFLFVIGYLWLENGNPNAGISYGVAALIKVWPTLFGLWLIQNRSKAAIIRATGVGVSGLLMGVLIFGTENTVTWLNYILAERSGRIANGIAPQQHATTLLRPLTQLIIGLETYQYVLLAAIILLIPLVFIYQQTESATDMLYGYAATIIFMLLIFPSGMTYQIFLLFPLISLLYISKERKEVILLSVATFLIFLPFHAGHILDIVKIILPANILPITNTIVTGFFNWISLPLIGDLLILGAAILNRY